MEKVEVGKIVNTHGIKGEIRIISDFPFKDRVFKIGNKLIIDNTYYEIKSYRVHKCFDMVTLNDFDNINEVLFLMNKKVYFPKELLFLKDNEILDEELKDFSVLTTDKKRGIIKEIFFASPLNKILRIVVDKKESLIPFNSPMIKRIDKKEKIIEIELIK